MLDFTASTYLGLRHARDDLQPWAQLTTGVPDALAEADAAARVREAVAGLVRSEAATLAASTLHASWDLFVVLGPRRCTLIADAGTYPIARWGIQRAAGLGARTFTIPHYDSRALGAVLQRLPHDGRRPVVVADGFCPACGRTAPMAAYLAELRPFGGLLVIDDAQAIGLLGRGPTPSEPYGRDGGGVPSFAGVAGDPALLVVASLAKGLGVPIAVIAGTREMVGAYDARSETRVHCSPPSIAHLHAAEHALALNAREGTARRAHLWQLVHRFRSGLAGRGLPLPAGVFPVQTFPPIPSGDPSTLYSRLLGRGIRAVLHRPAEAGPAVVSVLITARHSSGDVDRLLEALASTVALPPRRPSNRSVGIANP